MAFEEKVNHSLSPVLEIFKKACSEIAVLIRNNNSTELGIGNKGSNQSGDTVKKLDMVCQDIISKKLIECDLVRGYASEEEKEVYWTSHRTAPFFVTFDPLDGSSNIEVNIATGTIFTIFYFDSKGEIHDGRQIIAAGYSLYSSSTELVVATKLPRKIRRYLLSDAKGGDGVGDGVNGGVVDGVGGKVEWKEIPMVFFTQPDKYYSINESNRKKWPEWIQRWNSSQLDEGRTARWVGSLVADGHRTLIRGGIFSYPGDRVNKNGKLRLLYEAYPFAFIFWAAGGLGMDDHNNYLIEYFVPWDNIHQKVGLFLGDLKSMSNMVSFF